MALRSIVKWNIWVYPYSKRWWCWGRRRRKHTENRVYLLKWKKSESSLCANEMREIRLRRIVVWSHRSSSTTHRHASTLNLRASHDSNFFLCVCTLLIHLHQFSTQNGNDTHTIRVWNRNDQNTIKIKWITIIQMGFSSLRLRVSLFVQFRISSRFACTMRISFT